MRRLFSVIIALFMLVMLSSAVFGQSTAQSVPCMEHAEACTYCTADNVVHSVMDMSLLDKPGSVEELRVHEGTHAAEMRANPALCHPTWTQLLGMETRAYCAALKYLVARQAAYPQITVSAQKVYIDYLGLMQQQFLSDARQTEVKDFQIMSAWFNECGNQFTPNGQGK